MTDELPSTLAPPIRRIAPGRFLITEARYGPGSWLAPHQHARTSFVFVRDGDWTEKVNRRDADLHRGMLFIRRAEVPHANIFGPDGARCLFLECTGGEEDLPPFFGTGMHDVAALRHPDLARIGFRLATETWADDRATALVLEGLALELIGGAARVIDPRLRGLPWVHRAHERLRAECLAPPSIQDLADEAGVTATVFARGFKRQYRMSPASVVHMARLELALDLMRNSELPLAEIARRSGFADQSHFGRVFRRFLGRTPASHRREMPAAAVERIQSLDRRGVARCLVA